MIYFFEKNLDFKTSKADLKKPFQFATYCTHFMLQSDRFRGNGVSIQPCSCQSFYGVLWIKAVKSFEVWSNEGTCIISFVFLTVNLMLINILFFEISSVQTLNSWLKKQTHNQLSCLDLLITNKGDFLTSVYCKKCSIRLYTM